MEIPKYVPFMFDLSGKAFIDSIDLANILCEKHSTVCLWIEDYIINGEETNRKPYTVKLSVNERGKLYNSYFIGKEVFAHIGNKFYLSEVAITKKLRIEHRQTIYELYNSFCYMEAIA